MLRLRGCLRRKSCERGGGESDYRSERRFSFPISMRGTKSSSRQQLAIAYIGLNAVCRKQAFVLSSMPVSGSWVGVLLYSEALQKLD